MTNKNALITGAIVLILVGVFGGVVLFKGKGQEEKPPEQPVVEEKIEEISADELRLILTARTDKKAIKFEISNIKNIASVDYELSYLAKGDIPRGVIGHIEVKPTDKKITTDYLDLGTCSRNVCRYDEGVTAVKLILKITKKDGQILHAEKELNL